MLDLVALGSGFVGGTVAWLALRGLLGRQAFQRRNYRDRPVSTAGGTAVVAGAGIGALALLGCSRLGLEAFPGWPALRNATLVAVAGFGLLGLLDDMTGDSGPRGYRGHLTALRRGEVTTGAVKVLGGGPLALLATLVALDGPIWVILVDACVVALSANLANLLDRRPGRVTKAFALIFAAAMIVSGAEPRLAAAALVVGASAALLAPELREKVMLGDTGSNPIGAAVGLGLLASTAEWSHPLLLVVVTSLNAASEKYSFTELIESRRLLRWLDRLGRAS